MATYADYTYYTGTYLGTAIAQAAFPRLALRASVVIDQVTFNRAAAIITANTDTDTIDRIKDAVCSVAEEIQRQDANDNVDGIQSESIGSSSVTYAAHSSKQQTNETRQFKAAKFYLSATDLMFRGFTEDE